MAFAFLYVHNGSVRQPENLPEKRLARSIEPRERVHSDYESEGRITYAYSIGVVIVQDETAI
jgi:hypothetical protein